MVAPGIEKMCPFFIVSNVDRSVTFYREKLAFQSLHQQPESRPFFAIVGRDGAMLFLKSGDARASA